MSEGLAPRARHLDEVENERDSERMGKFCFRQQWLPRFCMPVPDLRRRIPKDVESFESFKPGHVS